MITRKLHTDASLFRKLRRGLGSEKPASQDVKGDDVQEDLGTA